MKLIEIEITGVTPLMHHRMTEDALFGLMGTNTDKKRDKKSLTPREIADSHVYRTKDGKYYIPSEYIVGAFSHISSDYQQKNSPRKSLKRIAAGIFQPVDPIGILNDDKDMPLESYEVDVRKATNHQKGAVAACRPRFDKWKTTMRFHINEDLLSPETAHKMLNDAGVRAGIGSFRVARGGYFGQFRVTRFSEIGELK